MDEQFVKMCERATKIQEVWKPILGDLCYVDFTESGWRNESKVCHITDYDYDFETDQKIGELPYPITGDIRDKGTKHIYLPTQKQLQEMVLRNEPFTYKLGRFNMFCEGSHPYSKHYIGDRRPTSFFGSMEQLWLAFAMKEKYNKIWNGEDWIDA